MVVTTLISSKQSGSRRYSTPLHTYVKPRFVVSFKCYDVPDNTEMFASALLVEDTSDCLQHKNVEIILKSNYITSMHTR